MTLGDTLKNVANKVTSGGSNTGNAGAANPGVAGGAAPGQAGGQQDMLDRGVGIAGSHTGHNLNRGQEEKISDGIRSAYTKATGGNIPIADKN